VEFTVPTKWEELTQEQLRHVFLMAWMQMYYGWPYERVFVTFFKLVCNIQVHKVTDLGWLCECAQGLFILDAELLPSIMEKMEWVKDYHECSVRLEEVCGHKAYDYQLQTMPFGDYLFNLELDFPHPPFYNNLFRMWGLEEGDEWEFKLGGK